MKRISDLTPAEVRKFHFALEDRFKVRFVNSGFLKWWANRLFNKLAAQFKTSVPNWAEIEKLRPCCAGKYLLLPYELGCDKVPTEQQIYTAIHETVHAVLIREFKGTIFQWYEEYFKRGEFRALEEAPAKADVAEVQYWERGIYSIGGLDGYCWTEAQKRLLKTTFDNHMNNVEDYGRGTFFGKVSRAAVKILKGF
jgi:hypothetical protein